MRHSTYWAQNMDLDIKTSSQEAILLASVLIDGTPHHKQILLCEFSRVIDKFLIELNLEKNER